MSSFLESILDDFSNWKTEPEKCIFVLPSKRAGFFLKTLMAQKADKTLLAPRIHSVESFVEDISGMRYATSTKLMFSLYEAYLEQEGFEKDSFYDFAKWGRMLLQDFNELDRYLVDTADFFNYLGSIQEIRHWTVDGSSTPMIDQRVRFWKSLQGIYEGFRHKLESEGLGYQGQIYRAAVGRVSSYLESKDADQHIFIGFNALNRAEEAIITTILDRGNGCIYWDADPYYLENPVHDAGLFLRKHRAKWEFLEKGPLKGLSRHFAEPKRIEITGLPKYVSQAKFCGGLLEKIQKDQNGDLGNTALVLGEESLLNPILHSLPKGLTSVNVTMGAPLKESPIAHLFDVLLEAFSGISVGGIGAKPLLKLLGNPFLYSWFLEEGFDVLRATGTLVRENRLYVTPPELERLGFPKTLQQLLSLSPAAAPRNLISGFTQLIKRLIAFYRNGSDRVALENLYQFHAIFNQLNDLSVQYPFLADLKSLQMLYDQLLEEERIDFQGEPMEGLQIMGMLESRNLDFETVIITSVNEGVLPAGKSNASFIPFDVKREFGLPTHKEKDAVYTYHFYRLLQRAKTVYICYNTEPDVLKGGEPSRFVYQLQTDPLISEHVRHSLAAPVVGPVPKIDPEIPKGTSLLGLIKKKAAEGFSPTSLSQFIEDPLIFYKKHLLGIRETDQLEESVAANTFGTVMHEALELLYQPLVGEVLKPSHLNGLKGDAPSILKKAFQKLYLKGAEVRGKNLIALQVMNKYLEMFFQVEEQRIRRQEVRILGVEKKLTRQLEIPGIPEKVLLKGTVDRMEEVDGLLQIIDYKTGRVEPRDLRIKEWDSLYGDPKKSKAFQVLCYSWLFQDHTAIPETGIRAGVFSFKNINAGFQWYGLHMAGRDYEESISRAVLTKFGSTLQSLIQEIFNPDIPFAPVEGS